MSLNEKTVHLLDCSACGKSHELNIKACDPITLGENTYGYSGICEESGVVVYVTYNPNKEPSMYFGRTESEEP